MGRRPSELQLQLFFLLASIIARHNPDGLVAVSDGDVADAAAAMAGTLEAAGNGVIAELAGSNTVSEGLRRKMDAFLAEAGKGGGSRFGREAAEVLRAIERGARHDAPGVPTEPTAYLTLLARLVPPSAEESPARATSPIILP
jgi:hypothetical protein